MRKGVLFVLSLAGQLGYMIAIPAVIGAAGGAYLDKRFETSPLCILIGLGLAITCSSYWIWKLIKKINQNQY